MASKASNRIQQDESVEEDKEVGQFNSSGQHFSNRGFMSLNQRQTSGLFKEMIIGVTLLIAIALGIALFLAPDASIDTEPITSFQVYQIKNYLVDVYACQDVVMIQQNIQSSNIKSAYVTPLSDIKKWLDTKHSKEDQETKEKFSVRKCAIIQHESFSTNLLHYVGYEYLLVRLNKKLGILNGIKATLSSINLQGVTYTWERINRQDYMLFRFLKNIQSSERGFYVGGKEADIDKQHGYFMQNLNDLLIEFYRSENAKSIVDFGCGKCGYIMNIQKAGFYVEAYDGNPYTPQITKGFAKTIDLIVEQNLGKKFDWVQSLQVGEHIPPAKTTNYVQNLVRHADKGMILSWAVIGQGGFAHINNKDNAEVIAMLKSYGFELDKAWVDKFRALPEIRWFKDSFMVFRKVKKQ